MGSLLFHYISLGIPRYPAIISLSAVYATYATYATYAKYTGGSCCDKRRAGGALQTDDAVVANPDPADAHAVAALRFQPYLLSCGVRPHTATACPYGILTCNDIR